jgi:hypothetical protein
MVPTETRAAVFLKPWVHDCAAELARLIYNRYRNEFITRRLVA